ncbi:MAG: ubiquinol-cytochrome c reductase iron-sulfur subunit [Anaplasmataceae bacterium]|nr:ubiquinol-cytochrome c reductase iron-sulfur subunit [Anaplasmataceae bacterium]
MTDNINEIGRRKFLKLSAGVFAGACALTTLKPLISSMNPSKDVLASSTKKIDVSGMKNDDVRVEKWLGKPIFIMKRSVESLKIVDEVSMDALKDQQSDEQRFYDRNWLVVIGVCTHLGCIPIAKQGDYNGWYCPCHGSHYDLSGRVRKGPAPSNLVVPLYDIIYNDPEKKNASHIIIGVEKGTANV